MLQLGGCTQVWLRYALAVAFVAVAALVRWAQPEVLAGVPYLTFGAALVAAAGLGGGGPGLLATLASALCVEVFFGAIPGRIDLAHFVTLERNAIFLAGGTGVSLMAEMGRRARQREQRQVEELRQSAAKLHESQERFAGIIESAMDAIVTVDEAQRVVLFNQAAERMFGCPAAQAVGGSLDRFIPRHLRQAHRQHIEHFAAKGPATRALDHVQAFNGLRANGEEFPIEASISQVSVEGQKLFSVILRDCTERRRAEAARDQAAQAIQQACRAKDDFLAVLSHELRTPLAPVLAALPLIQKDLGRYYSMAETLEMVRRNVELEARLIDDLLDITRIAHGKIELNRKPIDLCTIIHRAVEVCKSDIEGRALHFGVEATDAPYMVDADANRLQQVFWNLLKNAIKFTPHGGCVGLRCRHVADRVVVEVNDSGVGIAPEVLPRLFNAFEQGDRAVTRRFGGLGLGLAISKSLVEMHGGSITACSEGKGKGATFRVSLPVTAAVPQTPEPSAPAVPSVRPLRILLVEDHGDTARIMKRLLRGQGHDVATAGDVATALNLARQHHFNLLISDLGLPDGSGLDLMRQLIAEGKHFPAIALSGYGQSEDIALSHEAGFAAHLIKPVNMEQLTRTMAAVSGQCVAHQAEVSR